MRFQVFPWTLLAGLMVCGCFSRTSAPKSAQELEARFEVAVKAKDLKAIEGLVNWTGVSPEMRSFQVNGTGYWSALTAAEPTLG